MKLYCASPVCTCSFETRRMVGEIKFILWIILGSTDTSPYRSQGALAVKVAALKTNTKKLEWAGTAQSV